ncbi:uncharacterized protein ACN427_011268 [Glossina fuscipes fuscipes]
MTKSFINQVQGLNKFLKNFNIWLKQQWDVKNKIIKSGGKHITRAEKERKSHDPGNLQSERTKRTYSKQFNMKPAEPNDGNLKKKPIGENVNASHIRSIKPAPEVKLKPHITRQLTNVKKVEDVDDKPLVSGIVTKYYEIVKKSTKDREMLEKEKHMKKSEIKAMPKIKQRGKKTKQIVKFSRANLNAIKAMKRKRAEADEYVDDYKGLRYELVHSKNLPEFLQFVQTSDCSDEPFGRCFKDCLNGTSCRFVEYHVYRSVSEGLSTFIRNKRGKIIGAAMNTIMRPHDIEGEAISLKLIRYNQIKKHYDVLNHHLISRNPFNALSIKKLFDIRFMLVDREYNFKTVGQKLLEACETMAKGRHIKVIFYISIRFVIHHINIFQIFSIHF